VYATFMPKPVAGVNGSGMHTHQSLFSGDRNAFFDQGDEYHLSRVAKGYVAGLLRHAREITHCLIKVGQPVAGQGAFDGDVAVARPHRVQDPALLVGRRERQQERDLEGPLLAGRELPLEIGCGGQRGPDPDVGHAAPLALQLGGAEMGKLPLQVVGRPAAKRLKRRSAAIYAASAVARVATT